MNIIDLFLSNIFGFVGFLIVFVIAKSYFPSYLQEKGKNLATKEDINEITEIVESVKAEFSNDLEMLRWHLTKKANIHRLAAEREVSAIYEISGGVVELRMATVGLRPALDYPPADPKAMEEMYMNRWRLWAEKHDSFFLSVERQRLFLPRSIYQSLMNIKALSVEEGVSFESDFRIARNDKGFYF